MKTKYRPAEFVALLTDQESLESIANYNADHVIIHEYSAGGFVHGLTSREECQAKEGYKGYTMAAGSFAPVIRLTDWDAPELKNIAEDYGYVYVAGTWGELAVAAAARLTEIYENAL